MAELKALDIILFKGYWYNPMTLFIAQRTSCFYSHGAVILDPEKLTIIEATKGGVRVANLSVYSKREHRILRFKGPLPEKILTDWLISKKGKKYKYKSFFGYWTGIKTAYLNDPNEFVCVEFYSEMFCQNGINIWGAEKPTYIYPSDFLQNGFFEEVLR